VPANDTALPFSEHPPQSLADELEFLRRDRASGSLTVQASDTRTCQIFFFLGRPVYAKSPTALGELAIAEALGWDKVQWTFDLEAEVPESINVSNAATDVRSAAEQAMESRAVPATGSTVSEVEPVVLHISRLRASYLFLLAVACLTSLVLLPPFLSGNFSHLSGGSGGLVSVIAVLSPLLAGLGCYVALLAWRWTLILDSHGFTVQWAIVKRTVRWTDVASFASGWRGRSWNRVVDFSYRPEVWASRSPRGILGMLRLMRQTSSAYVPLFGRDVDAQVSLMEAWRRRWGLPEAHWS
jgi:hypothetical protein